MTAKMYYEADADPSVLKGRRIAVIGYGSQGHAHSLNLRDSGHDVVVGLHAGSKSREAAAKEGLRVTSVGEAVAGADVVMILVPDTTQAKLWSEEIAPNLKSGALLLFAHGFNIHFGCITPPADVDVAMVAPKGPGHLVRSTYVDGQGVPCLFTVHQDATGNARARTIAYAQGIGGTRAGIVETTFKEETETDLFGEQTVLCGGVTSLVKAGFETLVEAGYQEEIAYFEILHELKLIVDLMYRGGLGYMRYSVSDTAEYGDYVSGPRVIGPQVKAAMKQVLAEIQDGTFAENWIDENNSGRANFTRMKAADQQHPIEKVGAEMRAKMTWLNAVTAPDRVSEASA